MMELLRKNILLPFVISLALSFLLYANGLDGDFVADDKLVILQSPIVNGDFSSFGKTFFAPYYYNQPHAGLYRPLTIASYNLNKVFGSGPLGFHLVNVILNALNGFLVFLFVSKLLNRRTAYLAAALFLFLPIHSEAVNSIVGRAELLSFLFSAISLLFVLNKRYGLASVALLAGLLSKETAAGFFLVFLYLWKFKEQKTLKQVFYNSLYFIPPIAIYAILRVSVLGKYFIGVDHLMAYNPLRFATFFQSLWTSFKVFYLYLLKIVAPYQLSSDYSFSQIPIIKNPFLYYEVYVGIISLAALVYVAVKKRESVYGLSAAVFLLTYFLVSNWFIKIGTIMGERLMYAPSLGLVILAALWMDQLSVISRQFVKKLTCAGLVILLSWYSYVIIDRNRDWRNEPTLLRSSYEASSNSVVAVTNMAYLEFNNKNYSEARKWAQEAKAILPDHIPILYLAGHIDKKLGDFQSAQLSWLKVIDLSPEYVKAYLSLGILYYEAEQFEKAEFVLNQGFGLENRWNEAFPLALVKTNLGKYDEAIQLVTSYFGEDPQKRELKFVLGLAHLKRGDKQKAGVYLSQIKDPSVSIEDYSKRVINQKVFKIEEY